MHLARHPRVRKAGSSDGQQCSAALRIRVLTRGHGAAEVRLLFEHRPRAPPARRPELDARHHATIVPECDRVHGTARARVIATLRVEGRTYVHPGICALKPAEGPTKASTTVRLSYRTPVALGVIFAYRRTVPADVRKST